MKDIEPIQTVTLRRVRVIAVSAIDAELLPLIKAGDKDALMLLEHEDAAARRYILDMFGKTETLEMRCPATWWQHLKFALRSRWPRLFGRLAVRMEVRSIDAGAVMTGLPVHADRMVIPYRSPEARRSYVDDPNREDDW